MVKKDFFVLLIAVVCGALAFFLILNYLNEAGKPKQRVVLAAVAIEDGQTITANDVKMSVPLKNINADQFFQAPEDVIGMVTTQAIAANKGIRRNLVKKPEIPVQKTLGVPPGKTAITISANDYKRLPPQARIGGYLDISGQVMGENGKMEAQTVSSGAQIVDLQRRENGSVMATTVAVYPREVEQVFEAIKHGELAMTWRPGPAPVPQMTTTLKSMEIIRGLKQERTTSFGAR